MFADRLTKACQAKGTNLIIGFDPVLEDFPSRLIAAAAEQRVSEDCLFYAITKFYEPIIPVVAELVPAVKLNIAFFEQYGLGGMRAWYRLVELLNEAGVITIADAKRGDIGHTAQAYARAFFNKEWDNRYDIDALTINPFLGFDTLEPMIERAREFGRGLFILVRTSNPGSEDIQGLTIKKAGGTISELIARKVDQLGASLIDSSGFSDIGAVVGAQYPEEAKKLRKLMPKTIFLIPGFGTQGATAQEALAGCYPDNSGGIISASRSIFGELTNYWVEDLPRVSHMRICEAIYALKR